MAWTALLGRLRRSWRFCTRFTVNTFYLALVAALYSLLQRPVVGPTPGFTLGTTSPLYAFNLVTLMSGFLLAWRPETRNSTTFDIFLFTKTTHTKQSAAVAAHRTREKTLSNWLKLYLHLRNRKEGEMYYKSSSENVTSAFFRSLYFVQSCCASLLLIFLLLLQEFEKQS